MTIDPALLQALADRIHGLTTNGYQASSFPEPLATLWHALEANPADPTGVVAQWAGTDQDRLDLIAQVFNLTPGATPPPDPWQIYTLKDAYKPRPSLQFIVADMISVPSLTAVYGAPGSLKSMLVADMMVCVAGGIDWLLSLDPNKPDTSRHTQQVPSLWCDFDNGRRRTHERFDALARVRNLPESTPLHYVSMPSPWLDCSDTKAVDEFKQRIKRLGVQLVAIDNLGVVSGSADENSVEMIQVMASLRSIAEDCNAAVIVLHHQRKTFSSSSNSRAGESLRGHSSIEAALDLALLVQREEQSEDLIIKSTKTRDVDVFPFGAQFDYTHRPGSRELATARFWGTVVDNPKSSNVVQTAILDLVKQQGPLNQTFIVQEVKKRTGASRHVIRAAISELVFLGMLVSRTGSYGAIYYEAP